MDKERPNATETINAFRTPTRILLPKLLVSRDGWKVKATERKRKLKAAQIKNRDLETSRQLWKERGTAAQAECVQLREQLCLLRQQLDDAQAEVARLRDEAKKKSLPAR
jgi:chromosome segregation ATPase